MERQANECAGMEGGITRSQDELEYLARRVSTRQERHGVGEGRDICRSHYCAIVAIVVIVAIVARGRLYCLHCRYCSWGQLTGFGSACACHARHVTSAKPARKDSDEMTMQRQGGPERKGGGQRAEAGRRWDGVRSSIWRFCCDAESPSEAETSTSQPALQARQKK
jgi:hypothetical protein